MKNLTSKYYVCSSKKSFEVQHLAGEKALAEDVQVQVQVVFDFPKPRGRSKNRNRSTLSSL